MLCVACGRCMHKDRSETTKCTFLFHLSFYRTPPPLAICISLSMCVLASGWVLKRKKEKKCDGGLDDVFIHFVVRLPPSCNPWHTQCWARTANQRLLRNHLAVAQLLMCVNTYNNNCAARQLALPHQHSEWLLRIISLAAPCLRIKGKERERERNKR